MKRIAATPIGAELELLRDILQNAGIPCVIRNESISELLGTTPFNAELWVEVDEDLPVALEFHAAWRQSLTEVPESWTCSACGQLIGSQFDSCWQCGTHRAHADPLPCSYYEASQRAEQMSSVLDAILHQPG